MTATYDFTIRAGNSGTVANATEDGNELGIVLNVLVGADGLDMTGETIVFRVLANGTQVLRKDTTDDVTLTEGTDLAGAASGVDNLITVPITVTESRTLEAAGPGLTYDIERRPGDGTQRTVLSGNLFVDPGANDDV
jgi:hypothetical protein